MTSTRQNRNWFFGISVQVARVALALAILLALAFVAGSAQAQTFSVIHNFTGGTDGGNPYAGLTLDRAGSLYGTAQTGGTNGGNCLSGCGTVFKLRKINSAWVFIPLYSFQGGGDGLFPAARVVFGPNGSLYGTTTRGGLDGVGTVLNLKPAATSCRSALCYWNETLLYQFTDGSDGGFPDSELLFDQKGNVFSTAPSAGSHFAGVVYELTPSGGSWTQSVLYAFTGGNDGGHPSGGVVGDQAGNLYGVTYSGGAHGQGVVYQLAPSGTGWTENVLYTFEGPSDGSLPIGGLIFDKSGNLYGTTTSGGFSDAGTVFELSPSNGNWALTVLYSFPKLGGNPEASLVMDAAGNLYGTTEHGGIYEYGAVFELTPSSGGWTYTSLHDFCASGFPCSDGSGPVSNVVFDADGNLYGTAAYGGTGSICGPSCGVVWEITP